MYVGFDIGGTNVKHGVLNESGTILQKGMFPTKQQLEQLLTDLEATTKEYQKNYEIEGIGVSAPGIIQKDGFMTTGGAIPELYGVNLKEKIEAKIQLPVYVENDANAAAIAERWIGHAIGVENYLCIVLGTGVGGGIIINGKVYRGAHGMAGEFGYMLTREITDSENIEESSLNWRGAVVGGLCRQYNNHRKEKIPITNAQVIMQRAQKGEALALKVVTDFYQDLAVGLLNLIGSFDPEVILIGGGISANPEFMATLQATLSELEDRHESIAYLKDKTIAPVKAAKLQNDAGIIGAAYQIKSQLEK